MSGPPRPPPPARGRVPDQGRVEPRAEPERAQEAVLAFVQPDPAWPLVDQLFHRIRELERVNRALRGRLADVEARLVRVRAELWDGP